MNTAVVGNLRTILLAGVEGRCQRCNASLIDKTFHIHHIKEGGGNEDDNLEVLCPSCHRRHHAELRSRVKLQRIEEGKVSIHVVADLTREEEITFKTNALTEGITMRQWVTNAIKEKLDKEEKV